VLGVAQQEPYSHGPAPRAFHHPSAANVSRAVIIEAITGSFRETRTEFASYSPERRY